MNSLGYNYRMPDINASLGISQLKKSTNLLKKKIDSKRVFRRV